MNDAMDDGAKARAALLGAVPVTRMIDSGMEIGAALRLVAAVTEGHDFDVVAESEADALLQLVPFLSDSVQPPVRRAAIGALAVAQLAFNADTDRKRALYSRLTSETSALAATRPDAYHEVRIPFAGSTLHGVLVRPENTPRSETIILFGGLNGWGVAYLSIAEALVDTGLACLLVELPGQGNTRLKENLFADHRMADAVSACVDWVEGRTDLGNGTGVWGNSFGGLFAALAAAADPRIRAVCVNGASPNPTLPPFRTAQELMLSFFGVDSVDEVSGVLQTLAFGDRRIDCPLLVLHGGNDRLVTEPEQRVFLEAATGPATWRDWPDGQHTMYNHAIERNAVAAAWFADALGS